MLAHGVDTHIVVNGYVAAYKDFVSADNQPSYSGITVDIYNSATDSLEEKTITGEIKSSSHDTANNASYINIDVKVNGVYQTTLKTYGRWGFLLQFAIVYAPTQELWWRYRNKARHHFT